jgi:hypothetical protein
MWLVMVSTTHAQVVISEVMYDLAEGSDTGREWVEVFNKNVKVVIGEDVSGCEKEKGQIFMLVARAAHQVSEEEFVTFMSEGQIPAIKLASNELELLKGGGKLSYLIKPLSKLGSKFGNVLNADADGFTVIAASITTGVIGFAAGGINEMRKRSTSNKALEDLVYKTGYIDGQNYQMQNEIEYLKKIRTKK